MMRSITLPPQRSASPPCGRTKTSRAALLALGLPLAFLATWAQAQIAGVTADTAPTAAAVQNSTGAAAAAAAQTPVGLRIVPTLDTSLNVVNNDSPGYVYNRSGDIVATIRPGLQTTGRLGRSYGSLYYGLEMRRHSRPLPGQAESDNAKNALNASVSSEVVERFLFVDAAASISQQTLSAYGQQSVDNTTYNANRAEVTQLSVRPYTRGTLAGIATYDLAFSADAVRVKGTVSPDSRGSGLSLTLGSPGSSSIFGWGALFSQQHSSFSGGQTTDSTRANVSLKVRPDVDLQGSLRAGQESTRITGVYDATYTNYGGEIRWTPSPRTAALISADQRYFGRAYQLTFDHRLQRTAFRLTSTRDVSTSANATGVGAPVTLYQLFYSQFASIQPDPVLREQLVRDFLTSIGKDPNAIVSGGFVNGAATLQRREDFGLTYTGLRGTMIVQGYNSTVSTLNAPGSLFTGSQTRQQGISTSINYRLTPERSATLGGSVLRTLGNDVQAGNRLRSLSLNLSERLGRYATATVNARYSVFDGPINPYHETSLGASLGLRF